MRQFYFTIFFTLITIFAFGQQKPVTWTILSKKLDKDQYQLTFTADIEKGWVLYSMNMDPDVGPQPTEINHETIPKGIELGKMTESTRNRKEGFDKIFDANVIKFTKQAIYSQTIKVTEAYKGKKLKGYIYFMTCNDEKCMPPNGDTEYEFKFDVLEAEKEVVIAPTPAPKPTEKIVEKPKEEPKTPEPKVPAVTPEINPVSWNINTEKISVDEFVIRFNAKLEDGFYIYSQENMGKKGPMPTTFKINGKNVEILESREESENEINIYDKYFKMKLKKFDEDVSFIRKIKVPEGLEKLDGEITYIACSDAICLPPKPYTFAIDLPTEITVAKAPTNGEYAFDMTYAGMGCTDVKEISKSSLSLFWIFIAGFGGGLVALLTPCVFPMLPLTVAFFTKQSKTKAKGITNAIIYGLSIIVIYVGLGLIVTGFFGADALNQLSTSTVMNLIFFALFVIFALSFFGLFEIQLPNSWANRSDEMADKGGLIGIFFMAFTLSLVSFSCTGPIIGTLLVEASSGGGPTLIGDYVPLRPLMGMFGFALALALPFTLFAAFPGWLNTLPKSGGWMNTVKISIGILELALALKFLSTADLVNHWGILPLELFLGAWIVLFGILGLYLLGIIRFKSDGPKKGKLNPMRLALGVATLAFVGYLFTGFSYKPLSLLSGLAPPTHYNWFQDKSDLEYPDCPDGIRCLTNNYDEALKYAKANDLPILIDFTGHGCVNCRKVEENVWINNEVRTIIEEDYILVSLYVDERQKVDTYVSPYSGKKIRNVGNKWADFQEHFFKEQSQPLYVLVDTDGTLLHKPIGYADANNVADYVEFLQCGLDRRATLKKKKATEQLGQK